MTQAEAYRVLGISRSASRLRKEQVYQEKQKKLRLKLIPGNTQADRRKALTELAMLTAAWQVVKTSPAAKTHTKKPTSRKRAKPRPLPIPHQKPQTLAEAWELFAQISPFSRPVTVIIMILVFLLTIISLLKHF